MASLGVILARILDPKNVVSLVVPNGLSLSELWECSGYG